MMPELFSIPDFPGYAVDICGGVWSNKSGEWKQLKPYKIDPRDGRAYYILYKDCVATHCSAAFLMLLTFIGPRPQGMEACHNNGDCTDNNKANLRWDTPENNHLDRIKHNAFARRRRSW